MPRRSEPLPNLDTSASPRCPWDDEPVSVEGATCDPTCYLLQIEFLRENETVLVGSGDEIVALVSNEKIPLDITAQPWYLDLINTQEGTS